MRADRLEGEEGRLGLANRTLKPLDPHALRLGAGRLQDPPPLRSGDDERERLRLLVAVGEELALLGKRDVAAWLGVGTRGVVVERAALQLEAARLPLGERHLALPALLEQRADQLRLEHALPRLLHPQPEQPHPLGGEHQQPHLPLAGGRAGGPPPAAAPPRARRLAARAAAAPPPGCSHAKRTAADLLGARCRASAAGRPILLGRAPRRVVGRAEDGGEVARRLLSSLSVDRGRRVRAGLALATRHPERRVDRLTGAAARGGDDGRLVESEAERRAVRQGLEQV